nr:hypothetical protein [Tanacetum cinerariifolium]GFB52981.1 hypothetical protein [Tanacetum cinerariifolium]
SKDGLRRTGGSTSRAGKGVTGTGGGARSKEMGVSFAENDRSQIENGSQTDPVQDQVISSKPKAKPKLNIKKPSERNAN